MTFQDLIPLFDYSQFEIAIQNFFCDATAGGGLFVSPPDEHDATRETWTPPAGQTAFFTAFQAAMFQKARPRVSIEPISYKPFNERAMVLDANWRAQNRAFDVPLEFVVVTKSDYKIFTTACATVRAIVATMPPVSRAGQIQTTGLNAFMTSTPFELSKLWDAGNSLAIGTDETKGYYAASIKYNATFGIGALDWPGGTQTT